MTEPWVSINDVALHLGVQKASIYRWIEHRGLPASKVGKLWKFKLSEVDAWMRDGEAVERPGAVPSAAPRTRASNGDGESAIVLVVDDDPGVGENLRDFFSDEGYGVLLAGDGEEALTLLRSGGPMPVVILLDLGMPGMDGWQFRREQMADPALRAIPTVVVTADRRAEVEGALVLRKPLHFDAVAAAMEQVLGGTEARSEKA